MEKGEGLCERQSRWKLPASTNLRVSDFPLASFKKVASSLSLSLSLLQIKFVRRDDHSSETMVEGGMLWSEENGKGITRSCNSVRFDGR